MGTYRVIARSYSQTRKHRVRIYHSMRKAQIWVNQQRLHKSTDCCSIQQELGGVKGQEVTIR